MNTLADANIYHIYTLYAMFRDALGIAPASSNPAKPLYTHSLYMSMRPNLDKATKSRRCLCSFTITERTERNRIKFQIQSFYTLPIEYTCNQSYC